MNNGFDLVEEHGDVVSERKEEDETASRECESSVEVIEDNLVVRVEPVDEKESNKNFNKKSKGDKYGRRCFEEADNDKNKDEPREMTNQVKDKRKIHIE